MTVTINGSGVITGVPQIGGPAFRAYQTVAQSLTFNVDTQVSFDTKDFDPTTAFSTSTGRFLPSVAGIYIVQGLVQLSTTSSAHYVAIYKNGSVYQYGSYIPVSSAGPISLAVAFVLLNGTTDYVDLRCNPGGATQNSSPGAVRTNFSGGLVRAS